MTNVTFGAPIEYTDPKTGAERMRKHREIHTVRKRFVGCDGEGWDVDGKHSLMIMRIGECELYTGEPLRTAQVLDWLIGEAYIPNSIFVGFSFGYDVNKILDTFPVERAAKLLDRESRTRVSSKTGRTFVLPVDYKGYRLDWIPDKEFSIKREDRRLCIQDVFGCFQTSFLKAIDTWKIATDSELAFIEQFKSYRADFHTVSQSVQGLADIREYNRLECTLLARLMDAVRNACYDCDIRPSKWAGAGALAQAVLTSRKIGKCMVRIPKTKRYSDGLEGTIKTVADSAYYGGLFDVSKVGIFPRMYEYDINSAYPAALLELPCLKHAEWYPELLPDCFSVQRVQWEHKDTDLGYYHADELPQWGLFPIRRTAGALYYPLSGEGVYWSPEIDAIRKHRGSDWQVDTIGGYSLVSKCDCRPFDWVHDMYERRQALGKSGQGIVLKLALNSMYGKVAQSIGTPMYATKVWAGLITSLTRAKIHSVLGESRTIVMVATDAVYSTKPLAIPDSGEALGQWDAAYYDTDYMIVQPGLHFSLDMRKLKTRGIPAYMIRDSVARIEAHWRNGMHRWDELPYEMVGFLGLRAAHHWNRPQDAGQWITRKRNLTFGAPEKRHDLQRIWGFLEGICDSVTKGYSYGAKFRQLRSNRSVIQPLVLRTAPDSNPGPSFIRNPLRYDQPEYPIIEASDPTILVKG